jgi:AcrR family transcriptional regulator
MAAQRTARQLRADDTRARLFAAASELFATRGYHDTTVEAICKRAGVAKGTFFVHYATKDAVILDLVRIQTRQAKRARAAVLPEGPLAALRATVLMLGEQAGFSREVSRAVLAATLEDARVAGDANALFEEVLEEMTVDARAVVGGKQGELLARALMASYLGAALHFASSRTSGGLLEVLTPIVDANIQGFMEGAHAPGATTRARVRRGGRGRLRK